MLGPTEGLDTRFFVYSNVDFVSTFQSEPGSGWGMFCFVSGLFPDLHADEDQDHMCNELKTNNFLQNENFSKICIIDLVADNL
jgi:hypothetical protein